MIRQRFQITNMHCTMCSMNIDGALEDLPGVKEANTSFARARSEVTYDPGQVTVETLLEAIRAAGYEASLVE